MKPLGNFSWSDLHIFLMGFWGSSEEEQLGWPAIWMRDVGSVDGGVGHRGVGVWRAVDRFEEHFRCRELDLIRDERDVVHHGEERC